MTYLLIFFGSLLFFLPTLFLKYSVDDIWFFQKLKDPRAEKFSKWKKSHVIHNLFSNAGVLNTPFQEHLFTAILHALNCTLICKLTGSPVPALLYMVNPCFNQTAVWLNGRRYAVSVLCALLIMNNFALFLPLFAFASWLHVSIVPLPIIFLFTPYWYLTPIAVGLFFLFGFSKHREKFIFRLSEFAKGNELQKLTPKKAIIYVKAIGFYFFHTIFPNKPRMFHEHLYYYGRYEEENKRAYRFDFEFCKGVAALSFILFEIFVAQNIWAGWFLIFISPWCGIYQVTMNVADRYCSLAGVGLMAVLYKYISFIPHPFQEYILASLITFYVLRYLPLYRAYGTIVDFYKYHIYLQPDGVEARVHLAKHYLNVRDPYRAFAVIKDGLRHRPQDFQLLLVMMSIMFNMGQNEQGQKILALCKKYVPLGEEEEFEKEFESISKDPTLQPAAKRTFVGNRHQRRAFEAVNR